MASLIWGATKTRLTVDESVMLRCVLHLTDRDPRETAGAYAALADVTEVSTGRQWTASRGLGYMAQRLFVRPPDEHPINVASSLTTDADQRVRFPAPGRYVVNVAYAWAASLLETPPLSFDVVPSSSAAEQGWSP